MIENKVDCNQPGHTADDEVTHSSMSHKPLVTILICNYNYGRYLGEAIESALNQTWKNLEVIVVDDGSTDESREVLKKYTGIIRIILKENGGQASAFNAGFAEAKGDIICFLDSDDVWYSNRISRVIDKYNDASWGLVCHELDLIDSESRSLKNKWSHYAGVNMAEGTFSEIILKNNYSWVFSPTSGMSVPKILAEKIFPLPCQQWKISADNPLAYSASCFASVGIISESLGSYRLHNKNLFAYFHSDKAARRISGVTNITNAYFLCKRLAQRLNIDLPEPKKNYRYYRLCCLIARDKPYRYILNLLSNNIKYHLQTKNNKLVNIFNIIIFFAADLMIIFQRIFLKYSKANTIKHKFEKESLTMNKDQLRYILHDE